MPAATKSKPQPKLAPQTFKVKLFGVQGMETAAFNVPFDVQKVWGTKARVPVSATVNGKGPFRTSISPMRGCHMMVINREMRAAAGVSADDTVTIRLEHDTAPRVVEVPPDMKKAIAANKAAQASWDKYGYTHRKEFARWVTEARKDETRQRRIAKTVEMLAAGKNLSTR